MAWGTGLDSVRPQPLINPLGYCSPLEMHAIAWNNCQLFVCFYFVCPPEKGFWKSCEYLGSNRGSQIKSLPEKQQGIYIQRNRFIIRNCLVKLWRLTSPQICSWEAGDSGKPVIQFHYKSCQAWGLRRGDVPVQEWRQKRPVSQINSQAGQAGGVPSFSHKYQPFFFSLGR